MFCSECGTKNDGSSAFCSNCGNKLNSLENVEVVKETKKREKKAEVTETIEVVEDSKPVENVAVENKENNIQPTSKNNKKRNKLIIIIFIILAILGGTYYYFNNYYFSPDKVVEKFMDTLENGDYEDLYDIFVAKESDFVTKEKFGEIFEDTDDLGLDSYKIEEVDIDEDEAKITVEVKYEDEKEEIEIELEVEGKKYLLFNNWIISSDMFSYIVEDYEITVLKDSEVKIDGEKLDNDYLDKKESDDSVDVYVIPQMLMATYQIEVILPIGITIEEDVYVDNYDPSYKIDYIYLDDISDDEQDKIANDAMEALQNFYNDAIEGLDFKDIEDKYNYDGIDLDDIESDYEDLVSDLNYLYTVKELTLSDPNLESINFESDGTINVAIEVDIDYKLDYENYSGEVEVIENTENNSNEYFYIKYVDRKCIFTGVDYISTYFSIY